MLVIMKKPEYAGDRMNQDALAMECFRYFNSAYDDNAADSEVYLRQPDGEDGAAAYLEFTDGRQDPDKIKELAAGWNARIESGFDAALNQLITHTAPGPDGKRHWLSGPSPDIYALKKAAIALDGHVHDFGDCALLVSEYDYLTALFEPDHLKDVLDNPGNYVSFTVYPK